MKVIRDAVWGDIEVGAAALSLLDTPEMQRLRGVKQLGTASLVYPSAVHTRFEHALGTLHLAGRILDALAARRPRVLPRRLREATMLAALLHDVTHIPFGHTFEDERRLFPRHDTPARALRFLRSGALGRALEKTGLRPEVESTLAGDPPAPLMADVVRGTIGADLLDYLARDAYFCGLSGRYDARLFRYFDRSPAGRLALAVTKEGLVRSDAVSEVSNLLWLRYSLSERVYYHHAKIAAGAMISKAVEIALERGLREADLYALRDEGLFEHLRTRFPRARPLAAMLARLEARRLYKRAYVLTRAVGERAQRALVARFHFDRAARAEAEEGLARATGLASEDVIVYCPAPGMAAKEADIPLIVGGGEKTLADLGLPEVDVIVRKHRDLWRFYVFLAEERRDRAPALARACRERFGYESAFSKEPR
jgi:hypothetical protein